MRLRIAVASACALLAASLASPIHAAEGDPEWQPFEPADQSQVVSTATRATTSKTKGGTFTTMSFSATAKAPWEEYDKQVQASGVIGTLGEGMFGDTVEYYKNTLSFSVTNISLPGNFGLPVALTRKMTVTDRRGYNDVGGYDQPLQDWDLDIPNISGVYATTWTDTRCSSQVPPPKPLNYQVSDFWNGLNASMPGGGELIIPAVDDPATTPNEAPAKPTTGTYPWMTSGFTYLRCVNDGPGVDAVGNATGEGFEAITTDGTKYTFGWMAQNVQPPLRHSHKISDADWIGQSSGYAPLDRKLNAMYVTKVTDRFGNTVTYTYDNAATAPVRLRRIEASDGRVITFE